MMARFGTGIADGSSGIDAAGVLDGACSGQDRFEECGFTASGKGPPAQCTVDRGDF